jgi:hypothetical protein
MYRATNIQKIASSFSSEIQRKFINRIDSQKPVEIEFITIRDPLEYKKAKYFCDENWNNLAIIGLKKVYHPFSIFKLFRESRCQWQETSFCQPNTMINAYRNHLFSRNDVGVCYYREKLVREERDFHFDAVEYEAECLGTCPEMLYSQIPSFDWFIGDGYYDCFDQPKALLLDCETESFFWTERDSSHCIKSCNYIALIQINH